MTDFWPGPDPWNAFEQNPAWDRAGEPEREPVSATDDTDPQPAGDAAQDETFVRDAIQRVYHP